MIVISSCHNYLMSIKDELDKELNSLLLEKEGKHPDQIVRNIRIKEGYDKEAIEIRNQVDEDNMIGCLKEIFEWYASHANVSFSYLSGIVPRWGYPGNNIREIALRNFPDEKDKKEFVFYVVLNKRWFRAGFKKHYWVKISLHYDQYRKSLAYSLYTTDRILVTRWERYDNKFYDKSSLLEFIKTRLISKLTSSSFKKIDYWDTYHFEKTGLS